jgi:glycosyltransferase involved in cell wall biosynthesis
VKSLVYVAYFFPPTGGAGVQRTVKFVRYLPQHGWTPSVVTVRDSHYWMQDQSLSSEIPDGIRVIRTRALTGPALLGLLKAGRVGGETNLRRSGRTHGFMRVLSRWLTVPDPYVGWVPFATRAAARALTDRAVLMTTSSPDSTHLVGLRLARRGVPWVADFRDPWVRRLSFSPPTSLHRRANEAMEKRVVQRAARIIVTSEATRADFLARYGWLDPARILCITNGYDEEDFPASEPPVADRFVLLHLGQLNPERGIGPLLDHLQAFLKMRPGAAEQTTLELVGPHYREDERVVEDRGLAKLVRFEPALPHREAILRLLRARVLVLMEQEGERGGLILPGKTFEYLRARRPILGLLPHGAAWDLLTRLQAGCCCLPSDPPSGGSYLARCYDAFCRAEDPHDLPRFEEIERFERRLLAEKLAGVLDGVLAEGSGQTHAPS